MATFSFIITIYQVKSNYLITNFPIRILYLALPFNLIFSFIEDKSKLGWNNEIEISHTQ